MAKAASSVESFVFHLEDLGKLKAHDKFLLQIRDENRDSRPPPSEEDDKEGNTSGYKFFMAKAEAGEKFLYPEDFARFRCLSRGPRRWNMDAFIFRRGPLSLAP